MLISVMYGCDTLAATSWWHYIIIIRHQGGFWVSKSVTLSSTPPWVAGVGMMIFPCLPQQKMVFKRPKLMDTQQYRKCWSAHQLPSVKASLMIIEYMLYVAASVHCRYPSRQPGYEYAYPFALLMLYVKSIGGSIYLIKFTFCCYSWKLKILFMSWLGVLLDNVVYRCDILVDFIFVREVEVRDIIGIA